MTTTVEGTDPESAEFWAGVVSGVLALRRCSVCAKTFVLPLPSCPRCATPEPEIIQAAGTGTLYSWVVVHHAFDNAFAGQVPYVVAAVALDEGARVYGRLDHVASDELGPGLQLELLPPAPDGPPLVFGPRKGLA